MKNMDYLSKGYPDMSFHGSRAWYLDSGYFNRHFSFMLCGEYADEVEDVFIAFNMHWEEQSFDVPSPRSGMVWKKYLDTNINTIDTLEYSPPRTIGNLYFNETLYGDNNEKVLPDDKPYYENINE